MLILGIESASDQCGCALANEDGVIAETRLAVPRRHAEALAPQMRFVCEQAGVGLGDIDVVAVDHGPGLYTGLRAGLATAKATAAALGIGVVPVGSLEALAFGAAAVAQPGETVLSMLDARRGEVFWAWYRIAAVSASQPPTASGTPPPTTPPPTASSTASASPSPTVSASPPPTASGTPPPTTPGTPPPTAPVTPPPTPPGAAPASRLVELSAPQVGLPADLLPALTSPGDRPSGRTVVVGDGALRYADLLAAGNAVIAGPGLRFPSPAAVALLGRERALAGETVTPEQVDALYLRSPDAQPQA